MTLDCTGNSYPLQRNEVWTTENYKPLEGECSFHNEDFVWMGQLRRM